MDYYKIYKQLIRKGRSRQRENPESLINIYTEAHHIIPKCIMIDCGKYSKVYSAGNLSGVQTGKLKRTKDIIKVVLID